MDSAGQDGIAEPSVMWHDYGSDPLRVLIVGNDERYEQVLRTMMMRLQLDSNLEAVFIHNLADARRALHSVRVDVVVSDNELPDGSSADLFRVVDEANPQSFGILLTGKPGDQDVTTTVNGLGGPKEVWTKEEQPLELRRRMEHLFAIRALARSHSHRRVAVTA